MIFNYINERNSILETKIILEQLTLIEQEMNIKFPELYKKYLSEEVKDSEDYEIINNRNENIYIIVNILMSATKSMRFKALNLITS